MPVGRGRDGRDAAAKPNKKTGYATRICHQLVSDVVGAVDRRMVVLVVRTMRENIVRVRKWGIYWVVKSLINIRLCTENTTFDIYKLVINGLFLIDILN